MKILDRDSRFNNSDIIMCEHCREPMVLAIRSKNEEFYISKDLDLIRKTNKTTNESPLEYAFYCEECDSNEHRLQDRDCDHCTRGMAHSTQNILTAVIKKYLDKKMMQKK